MNGVVLAVPFLFCAGWSIRNKNLDDIASYIQDSPSRALDSLVTMDTLCLTRKSDKAKYALLYSIALDKNYIDTTDVSILLPAIKYYRLHGSQVERIQTKFYLGRIQYNAGDYFSAIISFKEANILAEKFGNLFWRAMSMSWIGYTYNKDNCSKEELNNLLYAKDLWEEYGDSTRVRNSLYNLAIAYHNNYQFDKADSLYCVILDRYETEPSIFCYIADNEIKRPSPDAAKVLSLFYEAIDNGGQLSIENYYEYSYALALSGQLAASNDVLKQLDSGQENIHSCFWRAKIARIMGDEIVESEMLRKHYEYSVSHIKGLLSQSVFKAESDHYKMMLDLSCAKQKSTYLWLVIIVFAFAIAFVFIFYQFRFKRNEMQIKLERASAAVEESATMVNLAKMELKDQQSKLEEVEGKLYCLRKSFASSYQKQFEEIARSFDYSNPASSDIMLHVNDEFFDRITSIVDEIRSGSNGQKKFEHRIDEELDGIMTKLRMDYPELKDSDFQFLSYVIVGFDATTRAIILNESIVSMRVKKHRLLKRIHEKKTENSELYDCFLK